MARSCEFEPKTRSTAVPVHLTLPVTRSRPSNTSRDEPDTLHSVLMSIRFTKKSLVNVSGRWVKTPCWDRPTFAFRARMPPTSTVKVANTSDEPTRVMTIQLGPDSAPVVLDEITGLQFPGGPPWAWDPQAATNGFQVLWLHHAPGSGAYVLMRSLGGAPGTEIFSSPDPFRFSTSLQGDVVIATEPSGDTLAKLLVLEKTGRRRTITQRDQPGIPFAVGDQFGWTDRLPGRPNLGEPVAPITGLDLWQVFTGMHTHQDLGCGFAGTTWRHIIERCADRLVLHDLLALTSNGMRLPAEPTRGAPGVVSSRTAIARATDDSDLLASVTTTLDEFPKTPPTVVWSTNVDPDSGRISLYLYYTPTLPYGGLGARLVDRSGVLVANGAVLGSGIFGPKSCVAQIDGALYHDFILSPEQLRDLLIHPTDYSFELSFKDSWHRLNALDSGCHTRISPGG